MLDKTCHIFWARVSFASKYRIVYVYSLITFEIYRENFFQWLFAENCHFMTPQINSWNTMTNNSQVDHLILNIKLA